jgi:streptogramin lyase
MYCEIFDCKLTVIFEKEKRVVDMLRVLRVLVLIAFACAAAFGATPVKTALTGIVSSDAEARMEGVVISAKRVGGTITVSVLSDHDGRYSFPLDRLVAGAYEVRIRATGYQAANPKMVTTIKGNRTSELNIKLAKTEDLAAQLTSAEWLMSIPGTQAQKEKLYRDCVLCHTLTPVLASNYSAEDWKTTLVRMWNWSEGGSLQKPLLAPLRAGPRPGDEEFARYLSSINLSSSPQHNFELKTLPRPHGNDTKVIITEYDLPRPAAEPHEAVSDKDGMVWYSDEAEGILGRLNPNTGATKEWEDPSAKQGFPGGFHDLELDHDGNAWLGRHEYNGVANFDKKTEKFVNYTIPNVSPQTRPTFLAIRPDGKVWLKDNSDYKIIRFDPKTGEFTPYEEYPPDLKLAAEEAATVGGTRSGQVHHSIYGMNTDSQGNAYGADIGVGNIIKVDAETGKTTMYPTPTPNSGPRRMHVDSSDRLWIGEWWANRIAVFNPKTEKFQEWPVPIPWYGPYDAVLDKAGNVWTGSMSVDTILRFNPKTGEFRQYLLPLLGINVRRIDVDNHGKSPVFWVGENRQAKIAKVEPLE